MMTQARIAGLGSFVGLDINVLPILYKAYGVPPEEEPIYTQKLLYMNQIAVKVISDHRARENSKK